MTRCKTASHQNVKKQVTTQMRPHCVTQGFIPVALNTENACQLRQMSVEEILLTGLWTGCPPMPYNEINKCMI